MINSWLAGFVGASAAPVVGFVLLFALVLLAVFVLFAVLRRLGGGTFVAGGRNRVQRLAVIDAAAVDGRRRLVLVRRDDVEHLILIGGPTDVVVEQNIRHIRQSPRPADERPPVPRAVAQPESPADRLAAPADRPVAVPAPVRLQAERLKQEQGPMPAQVPMRASPANSAPARPLQPPAAEQRPRRVEQPAPGRPTPPMTEAPPSSTIRPAAGGLDEANPGAPLRSSPPRSSPAEPQPQPQPSVPEPTLGPLAPDDRLGPADRTRAAREPLPGLGGPAEAREPTVDLDDAFDAEFSEMFTRELEAEQGAGGDAPEVSLSKEDRKTDASPPPIEHEMERLLGELSRFEKK